MKPTLWASAVLTMATVSAHGQTLTSGTAGGMPYLLLPAGGGCSAAVPCSIVTYLGYMDEAQQATASDVRTYFGGAFAAANPHTIVVAPMITAPQSTTVSWGGYVPGTTAQEQQAVAVVQTVERQYGSAVDAKDSVVTGGSLGGDGTQSMLLQYGPNGETVPGVFSAGLSFDAALYADAGNAATRTALCGVPLMAVHGTADTNQSVSYDESLAANLSGCANFRLDLIQGAGHGTWSGPSGYAAGTGLDTPLGWLTAQLQGGAATATPISVATNAATAPGAAAPPVAAPGQDTPAADAAALTTATAIQQAGLPSTAQASAPPPRIDTNVTSCPAESIGTGGFHVASGQIIGPNGPFIARGVNIRDDQMASAAGSLTSTFPGLNFVRLNVYSYQPASHYQSFINTMTSQGIVVELEDHTSSDGQNRGGSTGTIFSGALLHNELAWYSSVASAYTGNPYVWFGTDNEPSEVDANGNTDPAALSQWQLQTYQAIRNAGNNNPIMLEIAGGPGSFNAGMTTSVYAGMTNVIQDPHFYGWVAGYSTDQTTVDQALAAEISAVQSIQSADGTMPALIGEYGNSTDGSTVDADGSQVVTAVVTSGANGQYGSAAWAWIAGGSADRLLNSDGSLSAPYGQQVALYINIHTVPLTQCQATASAQQSTIAIQQQMAQDASTPAVPAPSATNAIQDATNPTPATTAPSDELQVLAAGDTLIQQAEAAAQSGQPAPTSTALIQQAQARLQAALAAQGSTP